MQAKEKTAIAGHVWISSNLVPRLMFYSFFFMGLLAAEIFIIATQFFIFSQEVSLGVIYAIAVTLVSMILFLVEGILLLKRKRIQSE